MCSLRVDNSSVAGQRCVCVLNIMTLQIHRPHHNLIYSCDWFITEKWSHTIFQELLQSTANPCSSSVLAKTSLYLDIYNAVFKTLSAISFDQIFFND